MTNPYVKNKMLILTGLFPNLYGNQSMLNSLKGYSIAYDITIITVANLTAKVYLGRDLFLKQLPGVRIYSMWPTSIKRPRFNFVLRGKVRKANSREDVLINASSNFSTKVAFNARSFILAVTALIALLFSRPKIICIYEINGMLAAKFIKKIFPKVKIFGKFQGTVLGSNFDRGDFYAECSRNHPLDFMAMKNVKFLDCAIMTNDGTFGDKVLMKFGLSSEKILFVPNGVDQRFLDASPSTYSNFVERHDVLKTISISRLIGWKRVDEIVRAIDIYNRKNEIKIYHKIIGEGTEEENNLIKDLIREKSMDDYVSFEGARSTDEVIQSLKKSDLLISVYARTNVTNPVFEALALCVPVMTIREEPLLDVLGERAKGCFFIEESASELLSEKLADALTKIKRSEILEKKSMLRKVNHPSWQKRSEIECEFISSILSQQQCDRSQ